MNNLLHNSMKSTPIVPKQKPLFKMICLWNLPKKSLLFSTTYLRILTELLQQNTLTNMSGTINPSPLQRYVTPFYAYVKKFLTYLSEPFQG